ncbi:HAD-IIA family hydrolase [Flavilitoribacter nigricans]|uniref:HAD family hydrolase n=1 Tax=Flavilitoribacter nigricans (strain ATCC 23147 / DSM 23189 / NBRC 102662 / NCIMB 1420 / SS-2) TaxID=1122177 RepID=A0A2D0N9V1_FLAN2|nr:HAD-IIA family hydrolase [Flavilitoribacter nigricans]PHN04563.1 HAD family hydrolase [Flavilitoribacter nigricans DSM 23189 = NBRC 102662]
MTKGFLIDMDGVIYSGNDLILGADTFISELKGRKIPFLFLTNNSQRTPRDVVNKLAGLGIEAEEDNVFTSAMATGWFLSRQKPFGSAYVLGEGGLLTSLHENGYSLVTQDPDFVVVGEGRNFTLEMVNNAVDMILSGAKLVATNLDPSPKKKGWTNLGIKAVVSMIEEATGVKAFSVGKPSPVMMRVARKKLGLDTAHTTIIGDTMDTDILGGIQVGYQTILTLSGVSKREDLKNYAFTPDLIVNAAGELNLDQWLKNTKTETAPKRERSKLTKTIALNGEY